MIPTWTDDPVKDAETYQGYLEEQPIPECEWCGYKIYDDYYYNIGGCKVCPDCIDGQKVWR